MQQITIKGDPMIAQALAESMELTRAKEVINYLVNRLVEKDAEIKHLQKRLWDVNQKHISEITAPEHVFKMKHPLISLFIEPIKEDY